MRRRYMNRGLTLVEAMVAGSIATVLGGVLMTITTSISRTYEAQVAVSQLSGYLDASAERLKRDIWGGMAVCQGAGANCIGIGSPWLAVDLPDPGLGAWAGAMVRYQFDTTDPNNVLLIRQAQPLGGGGWGTPRIMAHHIVQGQTSVTIAGSLVTLTITTSKTGHSGRIYTRSLTNISYRTNAQ